MQGLTQLYQPDLLSGAGIHNFPLISLKVFIVENLWIYHLLLAILFIVCCFSLYSLRQVSQRLRITDKLKKSKGPLAPENLLHSIIDNLHDYIYVKDIESRFIVASKTLANNMGVENKEDILGKTDHHYYPKNLANEFRKNEISIMTSGIPLLNKTEELEVKGEKILISTTKIPLIDSEGKIVGIVGIGKEVTETKKYEAELLKKSTEINEANQLLEERQEEILQQQEELKTQSEIVYEERRSLRALIDNMPDRIYIKDRNSRFIVGNHNVAKMMSAHPDQLVGKTDFDFYAKDLAEEYYKDEQLLMANGKSIINKEERGLNADGQLIVVSTTKVPFKDENGNVIGVVGIGRDITPQKEVEKKLVEKSDMLQELNVLLEERQEEVQQQSEELQAQAEHLKTINRELEKLSLVASRTDNVIVIMDGEANFEWVNLGFEQRYGMTLNEFRSKKGKNLRITSHNKKINEILDDIQKTKKSVIYNASTIGPDGTISWYQTTISPVLDENKNISKLIAIDSDITKLKLAEEKIGIQKEEIEKSRDELKKLNATKDKFFSIIAHDLKNPFHSIMGFSDLLIRSHDTIEKEKQIEFIQLIKDSSTSAYSLLENLLNWARTQTNRIQYTPGNIELNALIKENFQMMSLIAENKEISLFVPEKDSIKVYADFNMVNTVLRNLVSNAIKFTGKGGFVHIDAEVENERLFISVRDNGVGMSEKDLAKLFELDTYHSTSGTIGEIGTGLGLLVCKDFIERHGGELSALSKPGEGSTFRFSLPLAEEVVA